VSAVSQSRPFRLTAPVVSELNLQEAVADALNVLLLPPAMWTAFPVGHVKLEPAQAARLSRIGTARGWPDVLVLHERLYGIELKRVGGILSRTRVVRTRSGGSRVLDGQVEVFVRLRDAGMKIAVCHSLEEVLRALGGWGVPLRAVS
jgi:hypothetical protein